MNYRLVITLLIFILLFWVSSALASSPSFSKPDWADEPQFIPTRSHSIGTMTAMAQDKSGYLWFGSHYDIHRFDGYKRIVYSPNPKDPSALSGGQIKDIVISDSNKVWVATGANGVSIYSPESDSFTHLNANELDATSLPSNVIFALAVDNNQGIWVGTDRGLARVDEATLTIRRYLSVAKTNNKPGESEQEHVVSALWVDTEGVLWVGHDKGISRVTVSTGHYAPLKLTDATGNLWQGKVTSIYETDDNQIWIGTEKQGLGRVKGDKIEFYPLKLDDKISLQNGNIKAMLQVGQRLWVGTYGGGIAIIDIKSQELIKTIKVSAKDKDSGVATVWELLQDDSGLIWVSTTGGVFKYSPDADAFSFLQQRPEDPRSLSFNNILAVYEHSKGNIWISYLSNGLDILDASFNKLRHLGPRSESADWFSTHITDIEEDGQGNVWLASYGEGLYQFNENYTKLTNYRENLLSQKLGVILYFDGRMWIGTHEGLNVMDLDTQHIDAITRVKGDANPAIGRVFDLALHTDKSLWIASSNGLYVLPEGETELIYFPSQPNSTGGLLGKAFMEVELDAKGRMLLRSVGYGVEVVTEWDGRQAKFRSLYDALNLKDKATGHLTSDNQGRLWTISGMYDKEHSQFFPINRLIDGINLEAHSWTNSHGKTRSGLILYSTKAGLNVFDPNSVKLWDYNPPVVATEVLIEGKPSLLAANGQIELPPNNKGLTIEFAALDFSDPDANRYSYRLEGYDENWQETAVDRRLASFMNLAPGNYLFRVRGSNRYGRWSEKELTIPIQQIAAWYQTLGFKIIITLMALSFIYMIHAYRTRLLNIRAKQLKKMVKERTKELANANKDLELANDNLEGANKELKALTKELELLATTDSLTGLANVRRFREFFEQAWNVSMRESTLLTLILFDVDFFKRYNDTYGHQKGDDCLQAIAQALRKSVHRPLDLAARYGGEEFVVVLSNTDLEGARQVTERIRKSIESLGIKHEASDAAKFVTVSLGSATMQPNKTNTMDDLIKLADDELYVAKERGRNQASCVFVK